MDVLRYVQHLRQVRPLDKICVSGNHYFDAKTVAKIEVLKISTDVERHGTDFIKVWKTFYISRTNTSH